MGPGEHTKALAAEPSVHNRPKGSWEARGHYLTINLSPGSVPPRLAKWSKARKGRLKLESPAQGPAAPSVHSGTATPPQGQARPGSRLWQGHPLSFPCCTYHFWSPRLGLRPSCAHSADRLTCPLLAFYQVAAFLLPFQTSPGSYLLLNQRLPQGLAYSSHSKHSCSINGCKVLNAHWFALRHGSKRNAQKRQALH